MAKAGAEAKQQQMREAFMKFDKNGDGMIQEQEFRNLMKSLGNFSTKEISKLFGEADSDNSGAVDWKEFINWICTGKATKKMNPQSAASFARLLKHEEQDEATFVEQATLSKQLKAFLKDSDGGDGDKGKRKQARGRAKAASRQSVLVTSVVDLGIEADYQGFHLPIPVTSEGAAALMHHYLVTAASEPLHPKYVNYLTSQFTKLYKARHPKPVVRADRLTAGSDGRMVIVGDTHGQLADVLHILHQLGPPSPSNTYLFNGDMVDRGPHGVEILMILFAFFLADPESLIIHRGNHENEDMNSLDAESGGGFKNEVISKYGLAAYRRFESSFKVMSLCSVVAKEIFVVHGGLPRITGVQTDFINTIDHHSVTAPHPQAQDIKDQLFSDMLWSDPTINNGKFKSERGIGLKFGPDITTAFCRDNRCRFIVRSHQVPEDGRGYMKLHEGRCVTIFSASNYCGDTGNYGAVLVLDGAHFPRYEIIEHYAPTLEELPEILGLGVVNVDKEQQKAKEEENTYKKRAQKELERMIVCVIERKPQLWAHVVDMGFSRSIAESVWKTVMAELVDPELPWGNGLKEWNIVDSAGKIDMDAFLNRWAVHMESDRYMSFLTSAVKEVYNAIMELDMDIEKTMSMFDRDGDGTVDVREVRQVLGMFELGMTSTQLDRLTGKIFAQATATLRQGQSGEGRGSVDGTAVKMNVQEFLGEFTVVYKAATGGQDDQMERWSRDALGEIGRLIIRTPETELISDIEKVAMKIQRCYRGHAVRKEVETLKTKGAEEADKGGCKKKHAAAGGAAGSETLQHPAATKMMKLFLSMDSSGDGILQLDEFVSGLLMIPGIADLSVDGKTLTSERLHEIAKAIDASGNGNGTINYLEFLQAFESSERGSDIANSLAEDITTVLFRHRVAMKMGCQFFDEEGSGRVKVSDFEKVLSGVNNVLARPQRMLTSTQITFLAEALKEDDGDEDPEIDYDQFFGSFVIIDRVNGGVIKRF